MGHKKDKKSKHQKIVIEESSSSSSSESEHCKPKPCHERRSSDSSSSCSSGSSSSSSCSEDKKHRLYKYIKRKLTCDEHLFLNGSGAYLFISNDIQQPVAVEDSVAWNNLQIGHNIDFIPSTTDITIRQTGLYYLNMRFLTDQPSQFTVFINGMPDGTSVAGSSSGAVNNVSTQLLWLRKSDVLSVRNHVSSIGTVIIMMPAGGELVGDNATLTLFKVANCPKGWHWKEPCDRKKR